MVGTRTENPSSLPSRSGKTRPTAAAAPVLVGIIECVADRESHNPIRLDTEVGVRIDRHCQELGLLVRPLVHMCVMSPPLVISREQIDSMAGILHEGISRTMRDLRQEGIWQG